jgi:hypothetical protein
MKRPFSKRLPALDAHAAAFRSVSTQKAAKAAEAAQASTCKIMRIKCIMRIMETPSKNLFKSFSLSEVIPTLRTRTQVNTANVGYADSLAKVNGVN